MGLPYTSRVRGFTKSINTPGRNKPKCAHCDRPMDDYPGGYSRGFNNETLCHPNVKGRPNCYKLVTVYQHSIPCNKKFCYEDGHSLDEYIKNYDSHEYWKEDDRVSQAKLSNNEPRS